MYIYIILFNHCNNPIINLWMVVLPILWIWWHITIAYLYLHTGKLGAKYCKWLFLKSAIVCETRPWIWGRSCLGNALLFQHSRWTRWLATLGILKWFFTTENEVKDLCQAGPRVAVVTKHFFVDQDSIVVKCQCLCFFAVLISYSELREGLLKVGLLFLLIFTCLLCLNTKLLVDTTLHRSVYY